MLIFSTIAAVLSPIIYLTPFLILWKKGIEVYTTPKEKTINNKWVFIAKITLLIVLAILFVFTWPTKVMFYPAKVCIFSAILVVIQVATYYFLLLDENAVIRMPNKLNKISVSFWVVLLVLTGISGFIWADITVPPTHGKEIGFREKIEVEHISSSGNIFFYDQIPWQEDELKVISITDENVYIEITDVEEPYVEKYAYDEVYTEFGDKEEKIHRVEGSRHEVYTLFISERDLYKE